MQFLANKMLAFVGLSLRRASASGKYADEDENVHKQSNIVELCIQAGAAAAAAAATAVTVAAVDTNVLPALSTHTQHNI